MRRSFRRHAGKGVQGIPRCAAARSNRIVRRRKMSSPATQSEGQAMARQALPDARPLKTYAFVYAPGPLWMAGRPGTQQNLAAHRAYIAELYARRQVLFGGTSLDDVGG